MTTLDVFGNPVWVSVSVVERTLSEALPNSQATRWFTAEIPAALVEELEFAGLAMRSVTSMEGKTGIEIFFNEQVLEYIVPLFAEIH